MVKGTMVVGPETSNVLTTAPPMLYILYIYIQYAYKTETVLLFHREHCLTVKELYCYKEWRSAEERSHRGFTHSNTLPECTSLPSQQTDPSSCTAVPYVGKSDTLLYNCTPSCGVPFDSIFV